MPLGFSKMTIARVTCQKEQKTGKSKIISMFGLAIIISDLNLIENVWRMIKIRLARVQHKIKTKQELIDNVMTIWASFTPGYIQCLYNTIPDRLQAVIKAKGHATKY